MLERDDLKTAIEDARHRHNAVIQLMLASDNQALSLLRLFLTIALATAAGSVSTVASSLPLSVALGSATVSMFAAAVFCFRVIETTAINLPGRGAEFWLWGLDTPENRETVFRQYLTTLSDKHEQNNKANARQAKALRHAKWCALATIPVAAVAGSCVWYLASAN